MLFETIMFLWRAPVLAPVLATLDAWWSPPMETNWQAVIEAQRPLPQHYAPQP